MEFIIKYESFFYYAWVILFGLHYLFNIIVYDHLGNDTVNAANQFYNPNFGAFILFVFTFWWNDIDDEENSKYKSIMKVSNIIHVVFGIYSFIVMGVFFLTYGV